jgi:hypothetical protein
LAHCAQTPHATWEVLALLDQYHRRGKLPLDLYRSVSHRIQRRALGIHTSEPVVTLVPAPAPAPAAIGANDELSRELLVLRKELQTARSLAAAYLEQLKSLSWQRAVSETAEHAQQLVPVNRAAKSHRRAVPLRPARSVQAVAAMVFMLAVGASQGLGERENELLSVRPAPVPVRIPVPGQLSLATDTLVVQPGSRSAQLAVLRTGGTDGAVSFVWSTQSAGARAGTDFGAQPAVRLAMADGVNALKVSVPILHNPARRHTEMFYVTIGKPAGGAALGETQRAAVFIMRP